jgi:hypothetical protein
VSDCDELRELARELLDAEAAYRNAPTLQNTSRLARARRKLEETLTREPQRSAVSQDARAAGTALDS